MEIAAIGMFLAISSIMGAIAHLEMVIRDVDRIREGDDYEDYLS